MEITIENYNSIKSLRYYIDNCKINYLIGVSGAGKSSIAHAISDIDTTNENHVPYGSHSIPSVLIDNEMVSESNVFNVFNNDYLNNILINKSLNGDVYNIIMGEDGEIDALKKEYQRAVNELLEINHYIFEVEGKINTLVNDLKIDYKKDNTYKSSCLINKLTNNIRDNGNYARNKGYSSKDIKWFMDGTNTTNYKNGKCPFCNRKLTEGRMNKIKDLLVFDAKTYEKINSYSNIFSELNMLEPNWLNKREVKKFNKQIHDHYVILEELRTLIRYITITNNVDFTVDSLNKITVSNELKRLYPEIANAIYRFNDEYKVIKQKLGRVKSATKKLIGKNVKKINDYLAQIGIDYLFEEHKIDGLNKTAEYIIRSNKEENKIDRVNNLSYGEKNIIGLVLFLIANKNTKNIVIDDPASSFDEFKRKIVFDMIYKTKSKESTILVLSHDHVFAKFASFYRDKNRHMNSTNKEKLYQEYTGKIDYIDTFNNDTIMPIKFDDFDTMTSFIKTRLMQLPHKIDYQTAINLRLYYEINKGSMFHRAVYNYLSAILHEENKSDIIKKLANINKTEKDVINVINKDFNACYKPLDPNYKENICVESYNQFEKIIYARQMCSSKRKKDETIRDEINNIVHMNLAYTTCLDPYKFRYYSLYIYNYLKEEMNIQL